MTWEELDAFLSARLARCKVPKSLVLLNELPRTATGKVRKDQLRTMFAG